MDSNETQCPGKRRKTNVPVKEQKKKPNTEAIGQADPQPDNLIVEEQDYYFKIPEGDLVIDETVDTDLLFELEKLKKTQPSTSSHQQEQDNHFQIPEGDLVIDETVNTDLLFEEEKLKKQQQLSTSSSALGKEHNYFGIPEGDFVINDITASDDEDLSFEEEKPKKQQPPTSSSSVVKPVVVPSPAPSIAPIGRHRLPVRPAPTYFDTYKNGVRNGAIIDIIRKPK